MLLNVDVTQEDIDSGTIKSAYYCPIALALQRALPEADAMVGSVEAFLWKHPHAEHVPLPVEATDFISAFDHSLPVEPFVFSLVYKGPGQQITQMD